MFFTVIEEEEKKSFKIQVNICPNIEENFIVSCNLLFQRAKNENLLKIIRQKVRKLSIIDFMCETLIQAKRDFQQ